MEEEKLLTIKEICKKLVISRSTFERIRKNGLDGKSFPDPIDLGVRSPRYRSTDLNNWFEEVSKK